MESWSAHHLVQKAEPPLGQSAAADLRNYALRLRRAGLPVIFTLGHLAKITGANYSLLRSTVERRREAANYRMFAIKKRSGGRRHIHSVTGDLFRAQQFINEELLQRVKPHPASFAFRSDGGIHRCAAMHCGARWIFHFDIKDFFYSINEAEVYRVFIDAGYRSLLAFEMARLCTTTRLPRHQHKHLWHYGVGSPPKNYTFYADKTHAMGVLPQGAPSSPMLSNLAANRLDENLTTLADQYGLVYTRYADDLAFSASKDLPGSVSIGHIHRATVGKIRQCGFRENPDKTRVAGPGSKKMVLGLLVDRGEPRISREMYKRIDRYLYAIEKYGLYKVAEYEGFDSALGFRNHVAGLIAFTKDVDTTRWAEFSERQYVLDHALT